MINISIYTTFSLAVLLQLRCNSTIQPTSTHQQLVTVKTYFYNSKGQVTFADTTKLWYLDSTTIEELHTIKTVSLGTQKPSTIYKVFLYRHVDLRKKKWFDYKSFQDTAQIVGMGTLPDSVFIDHGWSYFSEKALQIMGEPVMLGDTIIDGSQYKRASFNFIRQDSNKNYEVGYLRCDSLNQLFSLEKQFSKRQNCTMTKLFSFRRGSSRPFASLEVDVVAVRFTEKELSVFAAWERNARNIPIK